MATDPDVQKLISSLKDLDEWHGQMLTILELLDKRLLPKADPSVVSRVSATDVRNLSFYFGTKGSEVEASTNSYHTRITFAPKPAHGCTCPDWAQRRRACKHVVAVAHKAMEILARQEQDVLTALGKFRKDVHDLAFNVDLALTFSHDQFPT